MIVTKQLNQLPTNMIINKLLGREEITFLFHIGFLCVLPLIGTSVFEMSKQIIQYTQTGYFYQDCMAYYFGTFNKDSFDVCKSTNIFQLIIVYAITTSMFLFIAGRVYLFITRRFKK